MHIQRNPPLKSMATYSCWYPAGVEPAPGGSGRSLRWLLTPHSAPAISWLLVFLLSESQRLLLWALTLYRSLLHLSFCTQAQSCSFALNTCPPHVPPSHPHFAQSIIPPMGYRVWAIPCTCTSFFSALNMSQPPKLFVSQVPRSIRNAQPP